MAIAPENVTAIDVWVDPRCRWAWIASRWLPEVERVRPVRIRVHSMSLSVLNENREVPEKYRQAQIEVRVCVAAARQHGEAVLRQPYEAMGTQIHLERAGLGRDIMLAALRTVALPHTPAALRAVALPHTLAALRAVALPHALADAAEETTYDLALCAGHHAGSAARWAPTSSTFPFPQVSGSRASGPSSPRRRVARSRARSGTGRRRDGRVLRAEARPRARPRTQLLLTSLSQGHPHDHCQY